MGSITDLLSQHISNEEELPFPWLKTISFSTEIIRPLVEKCNGEHLNRLLSELYRLRFIPVAIGRPLLTSHIQRIRKMVRKTDDPVILDSIKVYSVPSSKANSEREGGAYATL
jgi:hypothetical protein